MADPQPTDKKKRAPGKANGEVDPNKLRQLITDPVERRDVDLPADGEVRRS